MNSKEFESELFKPVYNETCINIQPKDVLIQKEISEQDSINKLENNKKSTFNFLGCFKNKNKSKFFTGLECLPYIAIFLVILYFGVLITNSLYFRDLSEYKENTIKEETLEK